MTLDGSALEDPEAAALNLVWVERLMAHVRAGGRTPRLIPPTLGLAAMAFARRAALGPAACAAPERPLAVSAPPPASEASLFAARRHLARDAARDVRDIALRVGLPAARLASGLAAAQTTFEQEQRMARLGRGVELLAETPMKIEAIARELGLGSKPWFIASIREVTGLAPGALRRALATV